MSPTALSGLKVTARDEGDIRALHAQLIAAANRGDAHGFAAPFSDDAIFVEFDGTHLRGRQQIETFHQPYFDTVLQGWRFGGHVDLVHFPDTTRAVMLASATTTFSGDDQPSPSRQATHLVVAAKRDDSWSIEALQNSRRLTLERQQLLDDLEGLTPNARDLVTKVTATLTERRTTR